MRRPGRTCLHLRRQGCRSAAILGGDAAKNGGGADRTGGGADNNGGAVDNNGGGRGAGVVTPAEARELWGESTEKVRRNQMRKAVCLVLAFHSLYGVEVKWDTITGILSQRNGYVATGVESWLHGPWCRAMAMWPLAWSNGYEAAGVEHWLCGQRPPTARIAIDGCVRIAISGYVGFPLSPSSLPQANVRN
eukprot:563996-Rhodomonas_salina.1